MSLESLVSNPWYGHNPDVRFAFTCAKITIVGCSIVAVLLALLEMRRREPGQGMARTYTALSVAGTTLALLATYYFATVDTMRRKRTEILLGDLRSELTGYPSPFIDRVSMDGRPANEYLVAQFTRSNPEFMSWLRSKGHLADSDHNGKYEFIDSWGRPICVVLTEHDWGKTTLLTEAEGSDVAAERKAARERFGASVELWSVGKDGVDNGGAGDDIHCSVTARSVELQAIIRGGG